MGSNGNKGVGFWRFTALGPGQVPVETQGCSSRLDLVALHLCSLLTPTPPFPLESVSPFDRAWPAPITNKRSPLLDPKAYPPKTAYRERASLLT